MNPIHRQILLMGSERPMEGLNGILPIINGIVIPIRRPCCGIMENRIMTMEKFQRHVIVLVVPLMGEKAGRPMGGENLVNPLATIEVDAPLLIESEGRQENVMGVRTDVQTVTVDDVDLSLPFGMGAGVGFGEKQGIERTLLKGDVGVHNHDVLVKRSRQGGSRRGGGRRRYPLQGVLCSILCQKAGVPYIRNDFACRRVRSVQNGRIIHVLMVMRTRPDFV